MPYIQYWEVLRMNEFRLIIISLLTIISVSSWASNQASDEYFKMVDKASEILEELRLNNSPLLHDGMGILVDKIVPGSQAEKKHITAGDIIVTYDKAPIDEVEQFINLIGETKNESRPVTIGIIHNNEFKELTIKPGSVGVGIIDLKNYNVELFGLHLGQELGEIPSTYNVTEIYVEDEIYKEITFQPPKAGSAFYYSKGRKLPVVGSIASSPSFVAFLVPNNYGDKQYYIRAIRWTDVEWKYSRETANEFRFEAAKSWSSKYNSVPRNGSQVLKKHAPYIGNSVVDYAFRDKANTFEFKSYVYSHEGANETTIELEEIGYQDLIDRLKYDRASEVRKEKINKLDFSM